MKWSCSLCGIFNIEVPDGLPVHCPHSTGVTTASQPVAAGPCVFQGTEAKPMSCGCGSAYRCNLLGKWCSGRNVLGEFVNLVEADAAGVMLDQSNFQWCGGCEHSAAPRVVDRGLIKCIESGRAVQMWPAGDPVECDVVIPFCSADSIYLVDAVQSILDQENCLPWIHIIADGCDWPQLPASDRILRYKAAGGLGPYRITNALADRFRTTYLAIQDADDISTPDRLWRQVRTLQLTGYDMISGAMEQFVATDCLDDETLQNRCQWNPIVYCGMCYQPNPMGAMVNSVKTMTVELFQRLGGFCDWLMSADHEWDARAAAAGAKLFHATDVFGRRRLHNRSLSNGVFPEAHPERYRLSTLMVEHCKAIEVGSDPAQFGGIALAPQLQELP